MRHDIDALDAGQLGYMWNFLRMGHQKSNIPELKSLCDRLRQAMIQMDGGRRETPGNVDFRDVWTLVCSLTIETMCLYLSGDLDRLEELKQSGGGGDKEGVCPLCGGDISYTGSHDMDDAGGTIPWRCAACGASGKEGYNRVFDRHYNVTDGTGNSIPGRPE